MLEKTSQDINIHDVDSVALKLLVDYCYSSEVMVSEENVQVRQYLVTCNVFCHKSSSP